MLKHKWVLFAALAVVLMIGLAACQPKTVIVEKKVIETQVVEVEKIVKETVMVEGEAVEVTRVVKEEVVVEVTPVPETSDIITLNVNLGAEPPQVDPALSTDTTSVQVDEVLFLGLTDFDDVTGEVIPELATD
jgi:ABC-type transport system substrate-binding protein